MYKIKLIFLLLICCWTGSIQAQQSIKGRVVAKDQTPLIGAAIQVLGTEKGTTTDVDGKFELIDVEKNSILTFSYLGFTSDTLAVDLKNEMLVTLKESSEQLSEITVKSTSSFVDVLEPAHKEIITEKELLKAACCNLSESFETNASVDVSFTDAVTGTKQIRMLGLDGRYVLINRENIPHIRGLNSKYGLSYVPGTWLQSIDVGKGAGTVVNGYESITGQINIELKKPENSERWYLNGYANSFGRFEVNANHSADISDKWSTVVLFHSDYMNTEIDRNDDGFMDLPKSAQVNLMNRYKYQGEKMAGQFGIHAMYDDKAGGQKGFSFDDNLLNSDVYGFKNTSYRVELFGKIGLLFPHKPYKGWGFIYSLSHQDIDGGAGRRTYQGKESTAYANVIYQNIIKNTIHQYKTGVSFLADHFDEQFVDSTFTRTELVPGVYYEYSYLPNDQFSFLVGGRIDFHNLFGTYFSPRLHLRYAPHSNLTLRASAGKGYRTPNAIVENSQVLVSSRQLVVREEARPEVAWNMGGSLVWEKLLGDKPLQLVGDYFYTNFQNQMIYDQDQNSSQLVIYNLKGNSYAHSVQAEVQYEIFTNFDLKAAYKYYNVKATINNVLQQVPYVSKDRFFVNAAYATKYEKWQADITWQWYGSKRLPDTSDKPQDFQRARFSPSFSTINMQVSRGFRWGNVYLGAENLLDFRQDDPIIDPQNPFGPEFDASMTWGPIAGRVIYAGFRYKIKR